MLCTDLAAEPEQIVLWFVRRWQMETTFQEVRQRLGFETQRQCSEKMGTLPANSFRLQKVKDKGQRETVLGTVATTVQNPATGQANQNVVRLALGTGVTLDKGSDYRVTITTAATDVAGIPLQAERTWRFKTAPK